MSNFYEFDPYEPGEGDYDEMDLLREDSEGWDLTDEEAMENADYINELRFGGDARSDREIKAAYMEAMREDDYYDGPEDW